MNNMNFIVIMRNQWEGSKELSWFSSEAEAKAFASERNNVLQIISTANNKHY
tara:strand:- start:470 stop:625 length:156 start_codon:yes stop_codon:yes gene_type:complete